MYKEKIERLKKTVMMGFALDGDDVLELLSAAKAADLLEPSMKLLKKLDEIEKSSASVFMLASIHGMPYSGPNWVEEYKALKEALDVCL